MKIADITKIIEGVLFVSGEGVDKDEFKRVYELSDKELNKCIDALKEKYNENSGINIISYKNKLQLCSNPELADHIAEILNPIRERSLTKSALETIAIIAYKQPITRTEIEQIRGVNCDYAIQLLQKNNLIAVVGRKDAVGKPLLFGTTDDFLKRFELESLDALPNHKELLDRIRVIHSEGDSLYREFTIPEDAENIQTENEDGLAQENLSQENPVEETQDEVLKQVDEEKETKILEGVKEGKPVSKSKRAKVSVESNKEDNNLDNETTEAGTNEPEDNISQPAPKLSWQERLRMRLAQQDEE